MSYALIYFIGLLITFLLTLIVKINLKKKLTLQHLIQSIAIAMLSWLGLIASIIYLSITDDYELKNIVVWEPKQWDRTRNV